MVGHDLLILVGHDLFILGGHDLFILMNAGRYREKSDGGGECLHPL